MGGAKFPGIQIVNPKGLARMEDKVGVETSQEDVRAKETYVKAVRKGVKRLNYVEDEGRQQGAPEMEDNLSVERDPQTQAEKRSRMEIERPEGAGDSRQDPQREENPQQGRGAYGEAPLQSTPVKVKVKRFEERSKGKVTPRGTKRK